MNVQRKMDDIMRQWLRENSQRHPYDMEALENEMRTAFGSWQSEGVTRIMAEYKRHRLHRRTIEQTVGTKVYRFQIYHEVNDFENYCFVMAWSWHVNSPEPARNWHRLIGYLSEDQMRVAWAHFKDQVRIAQPERTIPWGHSGDTWDYHEAWRRACNAAHFFAR